MRRRATIPTLAFLLVAACRPSADTAQGVAERFLDEHYVRIDLPGAREYCSGVALQKIDEEARLVGDQHIDASTRKPRVTYHLKQKASEEGDSATFVYEGTIHVEDADSFTKQWLVTTRREPDGKWKVSNFSEYD